MNSLNQLFQEILHSEKSFNERLAYLKELNGKIEATQRQLLSEKDSTESLHGQLVVKTQFLVDCKVKCQLAQAKVKTLEEQKDCLETKNKELKQKLDELMFSIETEREGFVAELKEFNKSYDLKGSGMKYREQQAQKKIDELNSEMISLEKEFFEMETKQKELEELEKALSEEKQLLDIVLQDKNKLQANVDNVKRERDELEKEKLLLTERFNEDPDLKKLRQELELCRNSPEEQKCRALKLEMERLQRECYKKQMKFVRHQTSSYSSNSSKAATSNTPVDNVLGNDTYTTDSDDWELDEVELASLEAAETIHLNDSESDIDETVSSDYTSSNKRKSYCSSSENQVRRRPGQSIYNPGGTAQKYRNKKVRFAQKTMY